MKSIVSGLAILAGLCLAGSASAHPSITSGPAAANKSQKITFGVSHGCSGADTVALRVEVPAGISSVRPLTGDFGKPSIEGTAAAVTAVSWRKPVTDLQDTDFGYYELTIRARVADVSFTKIYFRVFQTCRTAAGVETTVDWTALPGEQGNEAAALTVVPSRQPGWNRYTLGATAQILAADLPTYFADAQIVWLGTAAYSANPNTMALIGTTAGVTPLGGDVTAGQELWVKY
jgi:hypothetical protein